MSLRELRYLIRSDIYRYHGRVSVGLLLKSLVFGVGEKYSLWMRLARYLSEQSKLWFPAYLVARFFLRRCTFRYGIRISCFTSVGPGLYIGHFGEIIVSAHATIGRNVNLNQGVTIGISNRGPRKGTPTVGDNVYIGPGAKLFGNISIGNNVAIGANCVVTKDVSDNAVVVGVPGRVISYDGTDGYVENTDYDGKV